MSYTDDPLASITRAEDKRKYAQRIADHARTHGLDVTTDKVIRHFTWYMRWYCGGLPAGYLMRRLGIKRIGEHGHGRD